MLIFNILKIYGIEVRDFSERDINLKNLLNQSEKKTLMDAFEIRVDSCMSVYTNCASSIIANYCHRHVCL